MTLTLQYSSQNDPRRPPLSISDTKRHKTALDYLIYCDESLSKGQFFSHFYGGALVRSKDYVKVKESLDTRKNELNLLGEIKWTKVSSNYLDKYKEMMDLYFRFIKDGKIKVRIMFQATDQIVHKLSDSMQYHLLYYQFIKHAFGLPYRDEYQGQAVNLKLFFDEIPDTREQNDDFKAHLCYLQELQQFKKANIRIQHDDISEIDSHKHSIQQCMDIILGAMAFKLNNLHLKIPLGATEPGKKTKAKEALFKHILELIQDVDEVEIFRIEESTTPDNAKCRWSTPYRHWRFVPAKLR